MIRYKLLTLISCILFLGCDSLFQVDDEYLSPDTHYTEANEIYSAFLGVYSELQQSIEQVVVVTELKGDLLEPTMNATEPFWQLYRHEGEISSSLGSSENLYNLAFVCQDFIENMISFHKENPSVLPIDIYRGMVSNAIVVKTWSYLTIAKLWGEVRIVEADNKVAVLSLDDVCSYLIQYLHNGVDGINGFHKVNWNPILALPSSNLVDWESIDIPGEVVLAELYLWNKQYTECKNTILDFIETSENGLVNLADMRYNVSTIYGGKSWKNLFINKTSTLQKEMIAVVPFDMNNNQTHNLKKYFSNEYPNQYYLAPTKNAIDAWRYAKGTTDLGDKARGLGISISENLDLPTVEKYNLDPEAELFQSDGDIPLYRAAELHLMLAEAYCFLGEYEVAMALINDGVSEFFQNGEFKDPIKDKMPTSMQLNIGIRKRASLQSIELGGEFGLFPQPVSRQDSIKSIAEVITDETALELAFEGKRWFSLLRVSRNTNDPSILANKVAAKYKAEDRVAIQSKLLNPNNCFFSK